MRVAERDAHVKAGRAEHEASAAGDEEATTRHRRLAQVWRTLEAKAAREANMFAAVQETRRQWEAVTESTRRIAIAADVELRRRHPGMVIAPLRPHPAEAAGVPWPAAPAPGAGKEVWMQLTLDGSAHLPADAEPQRQQNELAPSKRREAAGQLMLGLTLDAADEDIPEQVLRIQENARIAQAKLDELANTPLPAAEEGDLSPGLAWPTEAKRERAAVLQPPRPDIVPSARVVEHYQAAQAGAGSSEAERG